MVDLKGVLCRRVLWISLYLAGVWAAADGYQDTYTSYVARYAKEYPFLDIRWTVKEYVNGRQPADFDPIADQLAGLTANQANIVSALQDLDASSSDELSTVLKIDDFLSSWKGILYQLRDSYILNNTYPIDKMRRSARAKMKNLLAKAEQDMPGLLAELDRLIRGEGSDSKGVLCHFVELRIHDMTDVTKGPIDLRTAVDECREFLAKLMRVQVRGAKLYDLTCRMDNFQCEQHIVHVEKTLEAQAQHLNQCTPLLMTQLRRTPVMKDVFLVQPYSNRSLYMLGRNSLSSKSESVDITEARVAGCGLRCVRPYSEVSDSIKWTIEDATPYGKLGFFIRGVNGCFVGFDRTFVKFLGDRLGVETAGESVHKEVLLCLPGSKPTRHSQTFNIEPVSASVSAVYRLKNLRTGKYLAVERTVTALHDDATGGSVVNLVVKDCVEEWTCTWRVSSQVTPCLSKATGFLGNRFHLISLLYLYMMILLCILLFSSLVIIWLYRKQIRRHYLQYKRVSTREVIIPPSYRFPSRK